MAEVTTNGPQVNGQTNVEQKDNTTKQNSTSDGQQVDGQNTTEQTGDTSKRNTIADGEQVNSQTNNAQTDTTSKQSPPNDGQQVNGQANTEQQGNTSKENDGGVANQATGLKDKIKPSKTGPPGGFDATPLPDAPPGYTVRIIFHKAENLPPSDYSTASSDPFLVATLKGNNPKRHDDDPDLTHRTQTIRKTTDPVWNNEWVVANVPSNGFTLKCRMYDEDFPDANDRLGNVTIKVPRVNENWAGFPSPGKEFEAKKRMISKRAFFIKGIASVFKSHVHMTPRLYVSMEVLGKSDPPYAQMYTVGPTAWVKHFSPTIGRLAGIKVNADEEHDQDSGPQSSPSDKKSQKYDFQANEMQLSGPVPPKLYHRYVEFRPLIGYMFSSSGLRGKILHKALHEQHDRIYNFDSSTEYGYFERCSDEAAMQFLKMAHFDEGGRIFTYVLTLDGLFRFTETGKEFGIDLLSKHTMHSDVERYIACSGEFFIRRLQHADASDDPQPDEKTHPKDPIPGGPPKTSPPMNASHYQLVIDNDSGTYRPDKKILPDLKGFLERNFPGLGVVAMHWEDKELEELKDAQRRAKKAEGRPINVVMNGSESSLSSVESELDDRERAEKAGRKSKREAAFEAVEDPKKIKDAVGTVIPAANKGGSSK